MMLSSYI